jgi:predicted nucleotidyltransferase
MIPGIPEQDTQRLIQEFSLFPEIEMVVLFDSRAIGNFRPGSDVDLAVFFKTPPAFQDWLDLQVRLDEAGLAQKIDLIDFGSIRNQDLKDHIHRVGITLFKGK